MQTARSYYDDCYTSLFEAELIDIRRANASSDGWRVYLDRTYFYPTSGGQPHDLGWISGFPVVDVVDEGDQIAHLLGGASEPRFDATTLECRLDWVRRYDHMQQHTGQHLLSAAFVEVLGLETLSFHMGENVSTIEIAAGKLDDCQIEKVERRANELVLEPRPVRISYAHAEEVSGLRKESGRTGLLRIVTIDAYDRSACGGTHVQTTAEIGPVQIRNLERVRGNIRLEFVCGKRALQQSKTDFRLLSSLAKAASVKPHDLESHYTTLRNRVEAAEKEAAKSKALLAQMEAKRLYAETPVQPDGTRRRGLIVAEWTDSLRSLAITFTAQPRAVLAVLAQSIPGTALLACSTDSGLQAGALWKAAFAQGGGKGGGSATLAQGSVTDVAALEKLMASAGIPFAH